MPGVGWQFGVGGYQVAGFFRPQVNHMKVRLVKANQATAARRRVYFDIRQIDGITPATGESGGQPQISTNGGAFTSTGIATLTAIGNGRYYADASQAAVATAGDIIETRYKGTNTAECPGDTLQVVAFDPDDADALGLSRLDAAISSRSTYAGGAVASVTGNVGGNVAGSVASVTGNVGGNVAGSVGSVTAAVTVGTNNDKTGYALTSGERDSIADALLKRDWTGVTGEAARSVLNALRALRNKVSVSGSTMTVNKEDDSTSAWTASVTTDAAADPITSVDPT
jgi:hypothetical protein